MLRIIAVGRQRGGPEAALFQRYAARIRPPLQLIELAEGRGSAAEIKRREASVLLAALPENAFAVALDQEGDAPDTARFASLLEHWIAFGRPVCFLIGGAEGLTSEVLTRADFVLSLGVMTWPHLLVRAMLAEQLFRSRAIAAGHPYHRAGRP